VKRKIPKLLLCLAAALVLACGCSTAQKTKAKTATQQQTPGAPLVEQADYENKPLPVLPIDPPLPPGSEDMSDDSWGQDLKKQKAKDKAKAKLGNSTPDDEDWGKE
jgi:hypothetical protein